MISLIVDCFVVGAQDVKYELSSDDKQHVKAHNCIDTRLEHIVLCVNPSTANKKRGIG